MSDPKATKMTLEEAVEITRDPRARYGLDRARAIVDQAVKAHKARCAYVDNEGLSDDFILGQAEWDDFKKLRALERGESETKP